MFNSVYEIAALHVQTKKMYLLNLNVQSTKQLYWITSRSLLNMRTVYSIESKIYVYACTVVLHVQSSL